MFREEATFCVWSVVAWSFVALLIVDWSVQMCVLLVLQGQMIEPLEYHISYALAWSQIAYAYRLFLRCL